jgi:branched-chain amino acid aminotransferase
MAVWTFINDRFVPSAEATLPIDDLSIQRGYGVFDFFRLIGQQPLFPDDHLQRFYRSAAALHLTVPYSKAELNVLIQELIIKNDLPDSGIRLTLTGGSSPDGMNPGKSNLMMTQQSLAPLSKDQIAQGIRLMTYEHQRQLPEVKTIDYLMAIWLQPLIRQKGFDDVLYHRNGWITECPRSNFFLVMRDDTIVTPAEGILWGITRKKLLQITRKTFRVEERPVSLEELRMAKEAFITSTTKGILPVRQIGHHVMDIQSNLVTRKLQSMLTALINEQAQYSA